jgi:hypothetical protein
MKLIIEERLQAVEVEVKNLKTHLEALPPTHDVSVDNVHGIVTDMVNSIFDHARAIERGRTI